MQRSDFNFTLPDELIAQYPTEQRTASRLLYVPSPSGIALIDLQFSELPDYLTSGDLLIFNNTQVIPARLFARKKTTGGQVELLIERLLENQHALVQLKASKTPAINSELVLENGLIVRIKARQEQFFKVQFETQESLLDLLQSIGHIPLPPYIRRDDTRVDSERYQTVYASRPGAVAAPTAGLHFDQPLLQRLQAQGVAFGYVTLHVGAGTFTPLRVNDLSQHQMHSEWLQVTEEVCQQIQSTKANGGRVIAVGTTSVRALETAAATGKIQPYEGETRLFITPGYRFKSVDGLITNFHLPESTLFMLVCAFGGYDRILSAYHHAVEKRYRFFSYGDAMFIAAKHE
ncbi:tRNA preQ1(34) S-adenosylmethionine ribosyltransferase-isomerase QueA [Thioflexithrix psekupsensis]|uniref:S-adenosylmethionine:tRNA ribosyltransferase-isomerase n=2 Tax=Thioflexithrix psekupsensis TaxID=1570016 RepID=A0A251X5J5_9GAMM|nr:tRNA preQ1(34) S-adenosylmethionine ribosyltransferase-isomerase QueA [Thioflexithrix psekupsensis]OUD12666.1 tRNA preQ1(34) S-adenosylmethionine ribosyltransferase-isomerase QueA [Thioflexithrix psekupsensis]